MLFNAELTNIDELRERNNSAPVNTLANEILCNVFRHLRPSPGWGKFFGRQSDQLLHLIRATHVCQRWRDVALADASLWARLPVTNNAEWIKTIVKRAQEHDLDVAMSSVLSVDPQITSLVLDNLPRVAVLILNLSYPESDPMTVFTAWMAYFAGLRTPALKSLTISLMISKITTFWHGLRIPKDAFLASGQLQSLVLHDINIDFDSHLFCSSLTSLTLFNLQAMLDPTPTQLMDMLRRVPRLKSLTLFNILPRIHDMNREEVSKLPRVSLRHLEHLSLHSEMESLNFFVGNVGVSSKLRDIAMQSSLTSDDMKSVISYLTNASTPDEIQYLSVDLSPQTNHCPTFRIYPQAKNDTITSINGHDGDPALCFTTIIAWPSDPLFFKKSFELMFISFRWTHLTDLDLTRVAYISKFTTTILRDTFGRVPSLRTVSVGTVLGDILVDILGDPNNPLNIRPMTDVSPNPSTSDSFAFPGLQKIKFIEANFVPSEDNADTTGGRSGSFVNAKNLARCLGERQIGGLRIQDGVALPTVSLHLHKCKISSSDLDWLQSAVDDFEAYDL